MRTDLKNRIAVEQSITPGNYTADDTGANVDLANRASAAVVISVGDYTDGTHTFQVEEADDDGTGSPDTFSAVADSDLDGTEPTVDAAGDADAVHIIGYHGAKRWLRVTTSTSGTTSGADYEAAVVLGGLRKKT